MFFLCFLFLFFNLLQPPTTRVPIATLHSQSIIDTNGAFGGTFSLIIQGHYAGYNLTIICGSNETCSITCLGNACFNTLLDCRATNSTCIVSCDDSSSIFCPTNVTSDDYDSFLLTDTTFTSNYRLTDLSSILSASDNECSNSVIYNSTTWDEFEEADALTSNINSNGNLCCRGSESCYSADNIVGTSLTDASVVCSSYYSCRYSGLITTDTSGDGDIICSGYYSCRNVDTIRGSSGGSIYCGGYYACGAARLTGAHSVYCAAEFSCGDATIDGIEFVYITGTPGALGTDIYSNGSDTNVHFMGYNTGRSTTVYCGDGDTCSVKCYTNGGCDEVILECNGTCSVFCSPEIGIGCVGNVTGENAAGVVFGNLTVTIPPSTFPTDVPSMYPSEPTMRPSVIPSVMPSVMPSVIPTVMPSMMPTIIPTVNPTADAGNASNISIEITIFGNFSADINGSYLIVCV